MNENELHEFFSVLSRGSNTYYVDVTMVVDATGGMSPFVDCLKKGAIDFCDKFHRAMDEHGRLVDQLRVRVVAYRDYAFTDCPAMECSEFFSLPEQNEAFHAYVSGISARGGGDEPESALEALALAMRSDWTTEGRKRRHVIMLFTDASAAELNDPRRISHPDYPADMPKSMAELAEMWAGESQSLGGMPEERSARLVAFTPNVYPWCDFAAWNYVWSCFCQPGGGLAEVDFDIVNQILLASASC